MVCVPCQFVTASRILRVICLAMVVWPLSLSADERSLSELLKTRVQLHKDYQRASQARDSKAVLETTEKAIEVERAVLGFEELGAETINSVRGNLARLLQTAAQFDELRGDYAAAIGRYEETVTLQVQQFGKDHWQVTDARILLEMARKKNALGPDERKTLQEILRLKIQLNNWNRQKAFKKALPVAKRLTTKTQAIYGVEHPESAKVLLHLAESHRRLGETNAAESLYQKVIEIQQKTLGKKHPDYALSLNKLASLYHLQKRFSEAESLCVEALAICREAYGENHKRYATCLNNLAVLYLDQGKSDQAEQRYRQLIPVTKSVFGEQHFEVAQVLTGLAELLRKRAEYDKAEPLYQEALTIIRKAFGPDHPYHGIGLNNLATLYQSQGDYDRALPLFRQALEIKKATTGEHDPGYALSLNNFAAVYMAKGDYRQAERFFQQSLAILKDLGQKDSLEYARGLNNFGMLREKMGNYPQSELLHQQALGIQRKALGENHPIVATTLNNLARVYHQMGDFAKAATSYREALDIFSEVHGTQHPNYAATLMNLADLYEELRDHKQAELLFRQALPINRSVFGQNHSRYALNLMGLASACESLGNQDEAERLRLQALEIYKELHGPNHPDYARCLNNLAMQYQSRGDFLKAEPLLREVQEIRKRLLGEEHPDYASVLRNRGWLYYRMGEYARSETLYREAFERESTFTKRLLRTQSEAGALGFRQTKFHGADPLLFVHRKLNDPDPAESYRFVWQSQGLLTQLMRERKQAIENSKDANAVAHTLQDVSRQLVTLTLATVPKSQREARRNKLRELNQQKETLERQLAQMSEAFRREQSVKAASPSDVMRLLPPGTVLVDWVEVTVWPESGPDSPRTAREYEVFILRKTEEQPGYRVKRIYLGPATPINSLVSEWLAAIDPETGSRPSQQDIERLAAQLREKVWEPLEPHLKEARQVVLLPDSKLHFLPWAALPGREKSHYLLEDFLLSTAISGQELYRQLTERPIETTGLMAVGGVNYEAREAPSSVASRDHELTADISSRDAYAPAASGQTKWGTLPGTLAEVQDLSKNWQEASQPIVLQGGEAHEAAVLEAMTSRKYIHLATHGFFADSRFRSAFQSHLASGQLFHSASPNVLKVGQATVTRRNPLILSGVVLAGANLPPVKDEWGLPTADDGILTAQEVVGLNLRGTDVVTLSACDTGKGTEVGGGDGVYGLRRAFHLAGARHVVASLWKVDDEGTAALMKLFYRNLWKEHQPPTEALRNAQLTILNHPQSISELARSRGAGFDQIATGLKTRPPNKPEPQPDKKRTPIHLWAAFTHSGPPALPKPAEKFSEP